MQFVASLSLHSLDQAIAPYHGEKAVYKIPNCLHTVL